MAKKSDPILKRLADAAIASFKDVAGLKHHNNTSKTLEEISRSIEDTGITVYASPTDSAPKHLSSSDLLPSSSRPPHP